MTEADVIALFQTPEKLLRRCYLHIAGGSTWTPTYNNSAPAPANGQATTATFKVSIGGGLRTPRGFTTGLSGLLGKRKDREFVRITKQEGEAKAVLAADEFNAYYIPMVQTFDVREGASHYTLPTNGAPDVMITSKLSGCIFGVGSDADGALLVSHVKADADIADDLQRGQDQQAHVDSGFTSKDGQFAKGQDYDDFAAVIGKRTGTDWKFYLQASTQRPDATYVISKLAVID